MAGESEKSPNRSEPILTDMTILSKGRSGDRRKGHETWKAVVVRR